MDTRARRQPATQAQMAALVWLRDHAGDGYFNKHGVVLAAGETAPHERRTWNALSSLGYVEFYNPSGKGRGRLRLSARGREVAGRV